jgi:hypothetical protein
MIVQFVGEHVGLRCERRNDVSLRRLHIDVRMVVDHRPFGIDPEQRFPIDRKARTGDQEQEHSLSVLPARATLWPPLSATIAWPNDIMLMG